jgi:exosortase D (VPLPA-CTERM-specific)
MNSIRIGFIGITVEHWGTAMAEGALHDFEGWLVFMLSMGALLLTALGLSRVGSSRVKWNEVFNLNSPPDKSPRGAVAVPFSPTLTRPFAAAAALVLVGAVLGVATPPPHTELPARVDFAEFPTRIGAWTGQRDVLQNVYLDALHLDDYVLANYRDSSGVPVNLYVAYYQTQDNTRAIHSPHDCIPGGGWEIKKFEQRSFPAVGTVGAFSVNRALVQLGPNRQIVYYWFQERGRRFTNEYVVRWYLFWDALTRHRTDGALVRFVAPLPPGAREADVDARILSLARLVEPALGRYVPD